ncbi:hypothetical protein CVU37_07840 [candidate division BRC1 bacterium HGW-BRC1-1]|jgi:prepilin-type N-terminal cleavage/methylation domain-containing protein|nr:MAG: hypothetical protein CVU37_07840 [candidate division BRC1 bacterium HGW-BRC1-1]
MQNQPSAKTSSRKAFTLIELLIVVAIIAILAAIAVPNFLEAQVRAKVSRTKADMRSMVTAIESYMVDNNKLFRTARVAGETRVWINSKLTTPISYVTSVFNDPFNIGNDQTDLPNIPENRVLVLWGPDQLKSLAVTSGGTILAPYPSISNGTTITNPDTYLVFSIGPNQWFDVNHPWPSRMDQYDSTNGTISSGDIVRVR